MVEEHDVDAPVSMSASGGASTAKVTVTEGQRTDATSVDAHGTTSARDSTSRGLHLGTLAEEDDGPLDTLAPSVRALKKGKFSSGRLSKPHFLRAEKIRDSLLDLSLDSNHSVTHVLGSVGLIIGPERELNRWQAAEAVYRYDPAAPKEKGAFAKYSSARYQREKEEHKDDLEGWHQSLLAALVEHRANEDMLDSKEAAVKNMEIVSQKATHLARQVASVKDIDIVTILISRDPTASQLASIVTSNTPNSRED
ncbi:hypothetical protein BKA70DRAFT_1450526 [Coprinopsis sp. MPI-PUGE-AT-0042]|nr:hypothetical protein BKA70DRAFT_1450526 [Coprinopsis sp. MPI-PUGE-AT-0042]